MSHIMHQTTYFYLRMWEKYVDAKCLRTHKNNTYISTLGSYISAPPTRIYRFVIAGGAFVYMGIHVRRMWYMNAELYSRE